MFVTLLLVTLVVSLATAASRAVIGRAARRW